MMEVYFVGIIADGFYCQRSVCSYFNAIHILRGASTFPYDLQKIFNVNRLGDIGWQLGIRVWIQRAVRFTGSRYKIPLEFHSNGRP